MIRTETKICLFGLTLLLLLVGGCRVRPPLPPRPYVVVPGEPYYDYGRHYGSGYRYRYYPGAQVYFDTSRNIYFYFSGSVWLSAPRLPRHIHIDRDNFVTMELDDPKPYLKHRETLKRYPPGLRKEKQIKQREERFERRDVKQEREEEQLRQKIERRERREDAPQDLKYRPIRREEKQKAPVVRGEERKERQERQEKIRLEEKRPGRQEVGKDRRKEQLREKEEREEERLRQKQEREEEPQEIRGRREDPQESREEKRREEKDARGKRSLSRKNKRGKKADDGDEYYDDMLPGGKIWK